MPLRLVAGTLAALLASALHGAGEFDLLISGGRIVDGTGAPWYAADIAIVDGRIARIGRLSDAPARERIDASGLIVAPGFVDMMGQSATPMLDEPKTALNLLTQGITSVNCGEGYSAAPIDGDEARAEGWRTMTEYFLLLELRGLPVNVAQTVGHTQVRRLVMGTSDRKPGDDELARMRELVRESMEAGAIGVSTALIYPPAVYADTDEIAALAEVAGEYGGRYYTHMRNEGDRLLQAIDEALTIGRKAKTPVHIFHLKAAGRRNWGAMEKAIARIKGARADGEQVTADIYPYVNNGLGIASLVHPRHFADGDDAFLRQLDDAEFRKTIMAEMESDEGEWENWFKHIGRDWNKLVVGRINSLRLRRHAGSTLAEIAVATGRDAWDIFFELVRTGAFVLPETMSEENKIRLIREEFVSFCTDVGAAGGASGNSHPRAYGSFPRLLSKYVRDGGAVSLERAVAQASAVAANEVYAFDRGRIAEGLAADIIIFDYEKLADRATFAEPARLSEGMRHVIVNGHHALADGEFTGELGGRVLRGPGFDPDRAPYSVNTGTEVPELSSVDQTVSEFMEEYHTPGAAVAVTDAGRLVYARGFGYADLSTGVNVMPDSLFRIASVSKPVTAVAIFRLIEEEKLSLDDKIFSILDSYKPPHEGDQIDERLASITVRQLLQHRGGWDRGKSFDAMFKAVEFARELGLPPPADQDAVIRNMLAQPLDFDPGARQVYSNFGYCLLGRAIARLTGKSYESYLVKHILDPLGARTMHLGRSLPEHQREGEVRYYSPFHASSVFAENLGQRVPFPYGGWHLEAMDAHGAWIASAIDLARFAVAFDDPAACPLLKREFVEAMFAKPPAMSKKRCYSAGWNRRESDTGVVYSHGGSLAGTSTLLYKRPDKRNVVILFNTRATTRSVFLPNALMARLDRALDRIDVWPEHDLFAEFPKHQPKPIATPTE